MAGRPRKQTVDYFPHFVNTSGKRTIFTLESQFGNDGYACWFKLLELLADTDGHYYDCRKPASWQFLQAKMRIPEEVMESILARLVDLEAIDGELWTKHRVIWCNNLVENLSAVYKNRRVDLPQKPNFNHDNPIPATISTDDNTDLAPISTVEIPQSKVKYRKDSKGKDRKPLSIIIPEWIDKELWDSFLEMRKKKRAPPTDKAIELLIKELEKLKIAGDDPNEVLKQSIMSSWTKVYPLKKDIQRGMSRPKKPGSIPTEEELEEQERRLKHGSTT